MKVDPHFSTAMGRPRCLFSQKLIEIVVASSDGTLGYKDGCGENYYFTQSQVD